MTRKKQRLYFIVLVLAALAVAMALSLYALRGNISFFYTPSQVREFAARNAPEVAAGRVFRLGGLVKAGSLQKRGDDLSVSFVVTDMKQDMTVTYRGILPDLFREGQGVVAKGALQGGTFAATELLAKHDEKYMPPEVAKALKKAHKEGTKTP